MSFNNYDKLIKVLQLINDPTLVTSKIIKKCNAVKLEQQMKSVIDDFYNTYPNPVRNRYGLLKDNVKVETDDKTYMEFQTWADSAADEQDGDTVYGLVIEQGIHGGIDRLTKEITNAFGTFIPIRDYKRHPKISSIIPEHEFRNIIDGVYSKIDEYTHEAFNEYMNE